MLPAPTLANLQAIATRAMDQTCQVQRVLRTPDTFGSATETWPTLATVAALLTTPTGQQLQQYAGRIGELAAWQVVLPGGTDVRVDDRLVIAGQTLVVQAVLSPVSYQVLVAVLATQLR